MTIDSDLTSNRNPGTYVSPTPFEIASIAAVLSKGKNPKEHLSPARNLWIAANHTLEEFDLMESDHDDNVARWKEEFRFNELHVLFDPNSDWDELREYLSEKLRPALKKAVTIRRNLREYYNETGQPEKARALKSSLASGKTHILKTTIDEFVKFKKGRKSDGGKKSQCTLQKRSTRTNAAKK